MKEKRLEAGGGGGNRKTAACPPKPGRISDSRGEEAELEKPKGVFAAHL